MKTKQAKHEYAVIVGNIGYVYTGTDLWEAEMHYSDYVQLSSEKYGRGAGEDVILTCDGEPVKEFTGSLNPAE